MTETIASMATETSRTRLYTALRPIGALAPLVYTFNVLWIAMVFFALATCLLTGADLTALAIPSSDPAAQARLAEPQARFSYLLDFFLWHLLDEVPLLSIKRPCTGTSPLNIAGGWDRSCCCLRWR